MKKTAFITLLFLFVSMTSFCQLNVCDVSFPALQTFPQLPDTYSDVVTILSANNMIYRYLHPTGAEKPIDATTRYFMFDAGTLLNYIYEYADLGVQHIDFTLSRDLASQTGNLNLVVRGVTSTANHLYLPHGVLASCAVCNSLKVTTPEDISHPCNVKWPAKTAQNPEQLENSTPAKTAYTGNGLALCNDVILPYPRSISQYLPNPYSSFISYTDAQSMINKYNPPNGEGARMFMFDAGTLAYLIYNTPGLQDIQFILARTDVDYSKVDGASTLTVVVVGVDNQGNHVYFDPSITGETFQGVLEHCYPCPSECPSGKKQTLKRDGLKK